MAQIDAAALQGLPPGAASILSEFLKAAQDAYSNTLVAAVLYGSAAEGRLGPHSDVNVMLVLNSYPPSAAATLRGPLLAAEAAIRLRPMFVLEGELAAVAELFGQKFADIRRRHRILFGKDVISGLSISRNAEIFRLRQVLMNLALRLRESHVARGGRPEQVARILADALGPLRASAAALVGLEGGKSGDAMAALQSVAASTQSGLAVEQLVAAHAGQTLPGDPQDALFHAAELAGRMFERTARLS